MDESASLLRELIELQRASIRLQKFAITLQAEALVHASFSSGATALSPAARERQVMRAVRQMRATVDRIEAGKALPK